MNNDVWTLIAIALYMMVIVGVGLFFARRANKNPEEYYLGGRGLGPWVAALSAEASDMSGWLLMGLPGIAYFTGASEAVWTAIGLAVGTYLNWLLIAKRLRKYSAKVGAITLPDFFSNRFHDKNKILMTVASLLVLIFFSIYVGSCFAAAGKLFTTLFAWDYTTLMIIGAIIVFAYTLLGGFLAESVSDLIQATVMVVSLIIILIGSLVMIAGSETDLIALIVNIPGFLDVFGGARPEMVAIGGTEQQLVTNGVPQFGAAGEYGLIAILSTMAWGLGYFGMPQVLLRFMAIRSSKEIKRSRRIAIVWCVISLGAAVTIGLLGRALMPTDLLTGSDAEKIFIELSKLLVPGFLAGIMMSGILAATMSSADSYMLISASAISKNLFGGLIKRDATDKQIMLVSRVTMVLILIFGVIIALDQNSTIFGVVSYAWAGFGASFGPLMILSLYWRRVNLPGAIAGMLAGGGMVFLWHEVIAGYGGIFAIYELLPAFIFGLVVNVVVSLLTKPPSLEIAEEFDTYQQLDV
jgi:sodium/proline symporter